VTVEHDYKLQMQHKAIDGRKKKAGCAKISFNAL